MKYIIEKHSSSRLVMKLDTNIGENSDMEEGTEMCFYTATNLFVA